MTIRGWRLLILILAGLHLASVMLRVGTPDRPWTFLVASGIWVFAMGAPTCAMLLFRRSTIATAIVAAILLGCAVFYEIEVAGPNATPEAPFTLLFFPVMQWVALLGVGAVALVTRGLRSTRPDPVKP